MRLANWEARLEAVIEAYRNYPFRWGRHDCCLFALRCVSAQRDAVPLAAAMCSEYHSKREALKILRDLTGEKSYAQGLKVLPGRCGFQSKPPAFAQRGDLVLIDTKPTPTIGIVSLDGRHAVAPCMQGLVRVPMRMAIQAWEV